MNCLQKLSLQMAIGAAGLLSTSALAEARKSPSCNQLSKLPFKLGIRGETRPVGIDPKTKEILYYTPEFKTEIDEIPKQLLLSMDQEDACVFKKSFGFKIKLSGLRTKIADDHGGVISNLGWDQLGEYRIEVKSDQDLDGDLKVPSISLRDLIKNLPEGFMYIQYRFDVTAFDDKNPKGVTIIDRKLKAQTGH